MDNNAKIGGILSIISGGIGALGGLFVMALGIFFSVFFRIMAPTFPKGADAPPQGFFDIFAIIYGIMGFMLVLIAALAIAGGVFSLKKRYWGLALAGGIAASYIFFASGIAALIFIAMARPEFQQQVVGDTEVKAWDK